MGVTWLRGFLPLALLLLGGFAPATMVAEQRGIVAAQWPQPALVPVTGGLERPTHVTHAGDGSGDLYLVEQPGRVRVLRGGRLDPQPFLDITDRVGSAASEQGLLSVAFPPGYAGKRYFYVNYTDRAGDTVVARYRLNAQGDAADPASEEVILAVAQPYANHNGGQLAFGPQDGYLYIGMGDGGGGGDPLDRAQNPGDLLGKLLRIDVEAPDATPYAIPPTNPFAQAPGYRPEIWALGFRNPWRFSFDRLTGDLYIGDVGQDQYEEVNFQPATSLGGENYGWNIMEGGHCYGADTCATDGLVLPVTEYDHGNGCSITGGMVYRGQDYPRLQGTYFYADYCSGQLWSLVREGDLWQSPLLRVTTFRITSFGEDEAGELYLVDNAGGTLYAIADLSIYIPVILK